MFCHSSSFYDGRTSPMSMSGRGWLLRWGLHLLTAWLSFVLGNSAAWNDCAACARAAAGRCKSLAFCSKSSFNFFQPFNLHLYSQNHSQRSTLISQQWIDYSRKVPTHIELLRATRSIRTSSPPATHPHLWKYLSIIHDHVANSCNLNFKILWLEFEPGAGKFNVSPCLYWILVSDAGRESSNASRIVAQFKIIEKTETVISSEL